MGDFNCDMIVTRYDNDTCKLINITDVYGLQQLITEPTRTSQTSLTLIDVILTNCPDKVLCMVFAYRKLCLKEMTGGHNTITYRNFRNFNRINFRNAIASQSWNDITNLTDPNEVWVKWKSSFLSIVAKLCPSRTMRVRVRSCSWITSDLKKGMHDRNILKMKAIKSNDRNDWMRFKKQRNLCADDSRIRSAIQNYYLNNFNECTGNFRKTWQTINELTSRKSAKKKKKKKKKKSVTSLELNGVCISN